MADNLNISPDMINNLVNMLNNNSSFQNPLNDKKKSMESENLNDSENTVNIKNSIIYSCPLFSADQPQNTMDWDPMQKKLYSGQGDGKILIWDIMRSKGKE